MTNDTHASIIEVFDLVASGYDKAPLRYFVFCADYLVDWVGLKPGMKVVDIGCGTGAVSVAASLRVGPSGRVQAIDLSEGMLAQAMQNTERLQLNNIDFHCMDAANLEFKSNYFNVALSSFVLFFLAEPKQVLKNWLRVLKPGATLAFTSFTVNAFMPLVKSFIETLSEFGVEPTKNPVFEQLQSEQGCRQICQGLALSDLEVTVKQFSIHLDNFDDWWTIIFNSGLRALLLQLDDAAISELKQQHAMEVQKFVTDKGLWLDVEVLLTRARKN